jgi:hypothetical protein
MSKVCKESEGIRLGIRGKLTDLDYADDICLLTHSTRTIQKILERLGKESAKAGLMIACSSKSYIPRSFSGVFPTTDLPSARMTSHTNRHIAHISILDNPWPIVPWRD